MPAFSLGRRMIRRPTRPQHPDEAPHPSSGPEPLTGEQLRELEDLRAASVESLVPRPLRTAAAWGWRLLIIAALIDLMWWLGGTLSEIVTPLATALLLTAALMPLNLFLRKHRWPHWLAALTCLLLLVMIIGGLLTLVGAQIGTQWRQLGEQAGKGVQAFITWLGTGPLHISQDQMNNWLSQARTHLETQQNQIVSVATAAGSGVGKFFAGLAMALFATFFFLKNGGHYARSIIGTLPRANRIAAQGPLKSGWHALVNYVRAAVVVAAVDGVGAGVGALILGSNLWMAIMALTFVCAFVPLIGALFSGAVAVAVTLVTLGFWKAVIMLAVFVAVLQLEAHILQPLLLGRAVQIPPLVVLVGIAVGMTLSGVVGGIFAIPIVAFATGIIRGIRHQGEDLAELAPGSSGDDPPETGGPSRLADQGVDGGAGPTADPLATARGASSSGTTSPAASGMDAPPTVAGTDPPSTAGEGGVAQP